LFKNYSCIGLFVLVFLEFNFCLKKTINIFCFFSCPFLFFYIFEVLNKTFLYGIYLPVFSLDAKWPCHYRSQQKGIGFVCRDFCSSRSKSCALAAEKQEAVDEMAKN